MADTDPTEAIELLADAAHSVKRDHIGEQAAAEALLNSLVQLEGKVRAKIDRQPNQPDVVRINIFNRYMFIQPAQGGGFVMSCNRNQVPQRIDGLRYNTATQSYQGEQDDPKVVPVPG